MRWDDVRARQLGNLEQWLAVVDRALQLAAEAPEDVPAELRTKLGATRQRIENQLTRLRENRFEIAILGLEKAGKSTLLNAWLGEELAPNAAERCSYATMEVRPAANEDEQLFRVEYHTFEEFERQVAAKRQERDRHPGGSSDSRALNEELSEIDSHRGQIDEYLRRGVYERRFRSFEEIRDDLKSAVAKDRARARAARRITLRTCVLRGERDVVFFDVPGFDSPVTFHREQAADKLRAVDVILYAKEAAKPSTTGPEQDMLGLADREDPHVKVAGKTFVALTRADAAGTREELDGWLEGARRQWAAVPPDRIVPVSAPARLAKVGACTDATRRVGDAARARIDSYGIDDGIDALQAAVYSYIENDRAEVLERRCDGLVSDGRTLTRALLDVLGSKYPDDIAEIERTADDVAARRFNEWWAREWRRIEEEFARFYATKIQMKSDVDAPGEPHPSLVKLREAFAQKIDVELANPELLQRSRMKAVYQREVTGPGGVHQPHHAHTMLRRELHPSVLRGIDAVSRALSIALADLSKEMLDEMARLLWAGDRVRLEMGNADARVQLYQHGLSTLFLRFARVVVDLLVSSPRSDRERLVERMEADILALAHFDPPARSAETKSKAAEVASSVAAIAETMKILPSGSSRLAEGVAPKPKASPFQPKTSGDEFESIAREIEEDMASLRDLLKSAVFDAAGFVAYCHQELEAIRARFLDLERTARVWTAVVQTEVHRRNPAIPFRLEGVGDLERRKRVAGLISQLRAAAAAG